VSSTRLDGALFTRDEVPPLVAALVVHYGDPAPTLACLRDLAGVDYPRLHVLVVDNDPERPLDRKDSSFPPGWEVLVTRKNLGYCRAVNLGTDRALEKGADYVLLLNNDLRLGPGFLTPLVEALEADERAGSAGPLILDPEGRIWSAGGVFRFGPSLTGLRGLGKRPGGRYTKPEYVDYFPGACVLHRAESLRAAGPLDEEYWMYMEDLDLALRMRQKGYLALFVPWSGAVHSPSLSTGGGVSRTRKYLTALNSVRFLKKWGTPGLWASFLLFDVLGLPLAFLAWILKGKGPGPGIAKARGILDGLRGRKAGEVLP